MENLGFRVTIRYTQDSPFKGEVAIYRNVTEIHYCYPTPTKQLRTAFESDIHYTGGTILNEYIEEFAAILEEEIADKF